MTTTTLFSQIGSFSERDRAVAELVTRLALHVEISPALADQVGEHRALKDEVDRFERQLAQQNPSLTDLLASTTKSKCCS